MNWNRPAASALLLTVLAGPGCAYNYTFKTDQPADRDRIVTEWKSIGLWGYLGPYPFDLEKACPEGVAEFGSYVSFPNWICAFLSAGLYTPRTVYAIPVGPTAVSKS